MVGIHCSTGTLKVPFCAKRRRRLGKFNSHSDCCRNAESGFHRSCQAPHFLKYWLPVLLWMAVIFTASSDRNPTSIRRASLRRCCAGCFPTCRRMKSMKSITSSPQMRAFDRIRRACAAALARAASRSKNDSAPVVVAEGRPHAAARLFFTRQPTNFIRRFVPDAHAAGIGRVH